MPITVRTDPEATKLPGLTIRSYEIDLDNAYPTGGLAWNLSADFDVIKVAVFEGRNREFELTSKDAPASAKVRVWQYDYPNAAVGAAIEVPNNTDLSAVTKVGVLVIGKKS